MRSTEEVWTAFGDRLRRFIAARVRNSHDVDDLRQDVFARIHAGLDGVENPEALESWLFQVTRRAIVDHYRKRAPVELRFEPADAEPSTDVSREVASWLVPGWSCWTGPIAKLSGWSTRKARAEELAARLGLHRSRARSRASSGPAPAEGSPHRLLRDRDGPPG
jgi:DNA-directed RNA polymerase specialized sigma24 family protein